MDHFENRDESCDTPELRRNVLQKELVASLNSQLKTLSERVLQHPNQEQRQILQAAASNIDSVTFPSEATKAAVIGYSNTEIMSSYRRRARNDK